MFVLLTYDIDTKSTDGTKRLRQISCICEQYGNRVQNSVFEMILSPAELETVLHRIKSIISRTEDSVRVYKLGKEYKSKITILGKERLIELGEPFII